MLQFTIIKINNNCNASSKNKNHEILWHYRVPENMHEDKHSTSDGQYVQLYAFTPEGK